MSESDDGLIDLSDMSFDFEDYFERFHGGQMDAEEREEFDARVLGLFCQSFIKSGGDTSAIPRWVASYLTEQIYKVLAGGDFAEAFRMPEPWRQPEPFRTRAQERSLEIFCDIANTIKNSPNSKITNAIAEVAVKHNASYETARAAYYEHVRKMPKDFLKRGVEN
jgi:hypothetical protein